jgi:hypothetical protein
MRTFVFTVTVLGLVIIGAVTLAVSWWFGERKRRAARHAAAREFAVKFRRRYGEKAEAAVAKSLARETSPRGRRFLRVVATELKMIQSGSNLGSALRLKKTGSKRI